VESVALCGTRRLDNSLPERIVVPFSRTYDFFSLEGSPTEPVRFSSLIKPNPSPLPRFLRERTMVRDSRLPIDESPTRCRSETPADRRPYRASNRSHNHRLLLLADNIPRGQRKNAQDNSEHSRDCQRNRGRREEDWTSWPRRPWPWPRGPTFRKR